MMTSRSEIVEEPPSLRVVEDKIYVAVGKDLKESKLTLSWALHTSGGRKLYILYVLEPAQRIPLSNFFIYYLLNFCMNFHFIRSSYYMIHCDCQFFKIKFIDSILLISIYDPNLIGHCLLVTLGTKSNCHKQILLLSNFGLILHDTF